MRRPARYTLNALTVVALLLCVATVALWTTSYRWQWTVTHGAASVQEVGVNRGWIDAGGVHYWSGGSVRTASWAITPLIEHPDRYRSPPDGWRLGRAGFGHDDASSEDGTIRVSYWNFGFPLWPICLAFGILPALRSFTWWRRRRRRDARGFPIAVSVEHQSNV